MNYREYVYMSNITLSSMYLHIKLNFKKVAREGYRLIFIDINMKVNSKMAIRNDIDCVHSCPK